MTALHRHPAEARVKEAADLPVPLTESARRRRGRRPLWQKLLVFALLAGAIGAVVYLNLDRETPVETFPTVSVERRDLVDKLAETGSIELVRTVEVKPTTSGVIRSLHFETGDWVDSGRLMAVIEPDPNQTLQLFQKRSAVENARISLGEQEKDYARKKTLFENRMLPGKDFEDADRALTRARNGLRLAELELEILETKANLGGAARTRKAELDEVRVLAPISGVVIKREVEAGEIVASGTSLSGGTVLFEIGDPSQMIVRADIAEIDIGDLDTGQDVDIVVDAFADTTYRGRIRWIAPVGEKKQGSTIVTFDAEIDILDREPRLRQGMSCDLDIIFRRREGTLCLPVEAVLELFDEEEEEGGHLEEVKGRRGRFVTYLHSPAADSAAADSAANDGGPKAAAEPPDTSSAGTPRAGAPADTAAAKADSASGKPAPPMVPLDGFTEVELVIGLETSTRTEILSGLREGDWVAADPEAIRRKLKAKEDPPQPGEREGRR